MWIIGLDLSLTNTGWAALNIGSKELFNKKTKKSRGTIIAEEFGDIPTDPKKFTSRRERIGYIVLEACAKTGINTNSHAIVLVEEAFAVHRSNAISTGELAGVMKQMIFNTIKLDAIEVANTSLKKFITGKGTGKKEDMKLALYKKYDLDFQGLSNDSADAYGLARLGKALFDPFEQFDLKKYEVDVLKKVRGSSPLTIAAAEKRVHGFVKR